jgi:flagellar protein FlaG|nr:MAG: hypothetical protein KatS3mg041_1204 [Bacteroidota bacterium]
MANLAPIERIQPLPAPLPPVRPVAPSEATASDRSTHFSESELSNTPERQNNAGLQEAVELSELGLQIRHLQEWLRQRDMVLRANRIAITFQVHPETGRIITRLIDPDTGEVIREIPPTEFLELVQSLQNLLSSLQGDDHESNGAPAAHRAPYGADPERLAHS